MSKIVHLSTQHTGVICRRKNFPQKDSRTSPLQVTCPDCIAIIHHVMLAKQGQLDSSPYDVHQGMSFQEVRDELCEELEARRAAHGMVQAMKQARKKEVQA